MGLLRNRVREGAGVETGMQWRILCRAQGGIVKEEILVLICVFLLTAMVMATPHAHLTACMCDLLHFRYT